MVDVDIDVCDGKVLAIIIPVPGKICGILGSDGEYVIPFGCIKKIGPDIILVEICEEKFLKKTVCRQQELDAAVAMAELYV